MKKLLIEREISVADTGDFYKNAAGALLNVFSDHNPELCSAFTKANRKWISAPMPYGFVGVDNWLNLINKSLNRKKAITGPSNAQKNIALKLSKDARNYAAGFVATEEEIDLLSGNAARAAFSLLTEAGFRIKLFIMKTDLSSSAISLHKKIEKKLVQSKVFFKNRYPAIKFFKTPRELRNLFLVDHKLRIIYSDIRDDSRAVSSGKMPFSTALFEPGYDGALETWRRLTELCKWDFNERYFSSK